MPWVRMPFQEQWQNANDVNASGFVLKTYLPGTTTATPMAIDKNGNTTVATVTLNADGLPEVSGNEVALYIDRDFKFAIYENATDATNNTNAFYGPIDNVKIGSLFESYQFDDYTGLKAATTSTYTNNDIVQVAYRSTEDDGGGGTFRWDSSDNSANVTAYPGGGVYVPPDSDTSGASGCWVRIIEADVLSIKAWGGVQDSSTDNKAAFDNAYTWHNANPSITLHIPGDAAVDYYHISADINLPPRVSCGIPSNVGTYLIQGSGTEKAVFPQRQGTKCDSISCQYLEIVGQYFSDFGSVYARTCTIKGGTGGTFWTNIQMFKGEQFILDVTDFSINQNTWHNINTWTTADYGIKIVDGGVGGATHEAHANRFINADFSRSRGISNSTVENQTNFIEGGYAETLSSSDNFVGTWCFQGLNLDELNLPTISPLEDILSPVNTNERTSGGYFSTTEKNLAVGGDWTALDSSGKPPCFSSSGGSSVVVDTSIPFNFGKKYGRSAATSQWVAVDIPVNENARFTCSGIWCGDLPEVFEVRVDGSSSFYGIDNFYEIQTGYYFFVVSGRASLTTSGLLKFYISNGGGTFEGYLSGVYMTSGRHAVLPNRPIVYQTEYNELPGLTVQKGKTSFSSSSSPLTVSVTFPQTFGSQPVVVGNPKLSVGTVDAFEMDVESTTGADFILTFSGTVTGEIHWIAMD